MAKGDKIRPWKEFFVYYPKKAIDNWNDRWFTYKILDANHCKMLFNFIYMENLSKPYIPAFAKGHIFHEAIDHFFDRLGTYEEVTSIENKQKKQKDNSKKYYYNADTFKLFLKGKFQVKLRSDNSARFKIRVIDFFKDLSVEQKNQFIESLPIEGKKVFFKDVSKKLQNNLLEDISEEEFNSIRKKIQGQVICWNNDFEIGKIYNTIYKASPGLYEYLLERGPPIVSEQGFKYEIDNIRFTGKIDAVFKEKNNQGSKIIISDWKSGNPFIDENKKLLDIQHTIYNVGICSLIFEDDKKSKELASILEISDETRHKYMGNPYFCNPDFITEYVMIDAFEKIELSRLEKLKPQLKRSSFDSLSEYKKAQERRDRIINDLPKVSHRANRTDKNFFEVLNMVKGIREVVQSGTIYPERSIFKCQNCLYKKPCKEKLEDAEIPMSLNTLERKIFIYMLPKLVDKKNKKPKMKKRKKDPADNQKSFAWGRGQNTSEGRLPKNQ